MKEGSTRLQKQPLPVQDNLPWRRAEGYRIIARLTFGNGEIGATRIPDAHNDLHALRHQSLGRATKGIKPQ
jgi:hypothetical protein